MKSFGIAAVVFLFLTTVSVSAFQTNETDTLQKVSGIVTDRSGAPLSGVSIDASGTSTGTVSDVNGKYSIDVPQNVILKFSYIGMAAQEIAVENRQIINVVMEEPIRIEPGKPVDLTTKQKQKAKVDNSLAFKLFSEISKSKGDNTFFSPYSLNMALGLLYNGSSGNTRNEIVKLLDLSNFSETEINEYYQKMSQVLLKIDPLTNISIANSIWYRNNISVRSAFIETCKNYFDANVQALDFSSSNAANIINNWCADKTKNKITQIVTNPVPDDMMMYLINALYFKSKWQLGKTFDKAKTKLDDFTKTNGQKIKANLMEQTAILPYYADRHLQCVELPYGNGAFSMIAILPSEDMNINLLIEYLNSVEWDSITNNMMIQKVWLKMPRFKVECELPINQPLMNFGMKQIFIGGFTNIADTSLYVSDIKQKTFVEVNEEGTEAVVLTATVIGYGSIRKAPPIEPVHFFANRPFLFLIREKSSGVILFIGRIDEPHE